MAHEPQHAPEHGAHGGDAQAHGGAAKGQHGGGHGGGGHAPHKKHKAHAHDHGPGTPPWLISFGDMMTLFLCFFIMLVTMAKRQDAGLVAAGLGPFVAALENHGMDASLSGADRLQAVNTYRKRFGLDPLSDPEQLIGAAEIASAADIEKLVKNSLRPYGEIRYPRVAAFDGEAEELDDAARRYLDLIAETLRPGRGDILVLEGHAGAAKLATDSQRARLGAARAQAVKAYLTEVHGFVPQRVEARAWAIEPASSDADGGRVDGRFIQPTPQADT